MKIGTDASLQICLEEGYLTMEYKKRELMPKGVLDKLYSVRFVQSVPDYILKEQYGTASRRVVSIKGGQINLTSVSLCANDIWEKYQSYKKSIDKYSGTSEGFEFPTNEFELLGLADDVNGYCGLE